MRVSANAYVVSANIEAMSFNGSGNFTGTGNGSDNKVTGGEGNDVLDGKGGADTLTGDEGNDRFLFTRGQADDDTVTDFAGAGVAGGDKLVFSGYGNGTISRVGSTDYFVIKADAAHGGGSESIRLSGVTKLGAGDYEFDGVTAVNAAPTDVASTNLVVKENATSGTTIGILSAEDPDAGDTASFQLLDSSGGLFKLSGSELILAGGLNYNTSSKHVIKVQATDSAGNTYSKSLTVTVTQVKTDETFLGTNGDDSFAYSSLAGYKRVDGRSGSDSFTMQAATIAVSAKASDISLDIGANGSADFATANVEKLVLSGSQIAFTGSVAATSVVFGNITLNGTSADDTLDGKLAGVQLVIDGGEGDDVLSGSDLGDTLNGGAGSDKLYANGGADTLRGGNGSDTYYLDDEGQIVIENADEGRDRVIVRENYTLGDNIEDLTLAGTFGHEGTGNALDNQLVGSLGDDILDGKAGADTLTGEAGADTFVFSAGEADGDTITDFAGAGGDVLVFNGFGNGTITRIGTTDSYRITADAAHGGATETIRIVGVTDLSASNYQFVTSGSSNSAPTSIVASNLEIAENAAEGTIIGLLSTLDPDEGDTATFRLTSDAAGLFALNGNQLVIVGALDYESSHSHSIRVQATDSAGNTFTRWLTVAVTDVADDDTLRGSWGDDSFIYGEGLSYDRIDGRGGSDTLTMTVGTVFVSATNGDVAIDIDANGSVDFSTINVEHLVLSGTNVSFVDDLAPTDLMDGEITITGTGEDDVLDATQAGVRVVIEGGDGKDVIKGGDQADTLVGGTGSDKLYARAGADILVGGLGNDTFYLEDESQTVVEYAGGGTDRVVVKFDYTLAAFFENLTLAGAKGHAGTGNSLDNRMVGSGGDDVLDGKGGADVIIAGEGDDVLVGGQDDDMLTGGRGADTFRFTALDRAGLDTIRDFAHDVDHIELAKSAFTALSNGPLDSTAFHLGTAAITTEQHLIYDRGSGALYYDEDGAGGEAQVQIALLSTRPGLDAGDLFVI